MSLILDALNRSRQESEQVPGLASEHSSHRVYSGQSRRGNGLQWLLVFGLALAVALIGWLLLDRSQPIASVAPGAPAEDDRIQNNVTPGAVVPDVVIARARQPQNSVPENLPRGALAETEAAERASQVQQSAESAAQETAVIAPEESPQNLPAPAAGERADTDPSVAALYEQQSRNTGGGPQPREASARPAVAPDPAPTATRQSEEALDIEALVARAQSELANAELEDVGVPFLTTLSQQTKDTVPTLMYQRHDYSGNSSESSVVMNGKTLRAGEAVGGVKVLEILPDSTVLEFRGTRFRLRALNSWVNL